MAVRKLDLRTEPKQTRARVRVGSILAVTEDMLADGEKVTTSSIAQKAGIPVGSVYRYFPDLNAIYRRLYVNINGEMLKKIEIEFQNDDPALNWQHTFDRCVDIMRDTYKSNPAYGMLLLLMENPELRDFKSRNRDGIIEALANRWRGGRDSFSGTDPVIVATTVIEMATSNELRFFLEKDKNSRDKLYAEGTLAIAAYLNIYLKS